jgi:hypothetical protein
VLSKVVDSQLLLQIERYLKQAIVDKSAIVASAALVSGMHLLPNNQEVRNEYYLYLYSMPLPFLCAFYECSRSGRIGVEFQW